MNQVVAGSKGVWREGATKDSFDVVRLRPRLVTIGRGETTMMQPNLQ